MFETIAGHDFGAVISIVTRRVEKVDITGVFCWDGNLVGRD